MKWLIVFSLLCFSGCMQDGLPGQNGEQGNQGSMGEQGIQGPMSPAGTNGTDAYPIYMVKLCPNDNSQFPEYAQAYYNPTTQQYEIYKVIWRVKNGKTQAYLTLVIPGTYSNTGGNGCTYTVNADGSIT